MAAFTPLVSVVVPIRDRPALLKRAVAAVLGQNYSGNFECVVVFDHSPPRLPEGFTVPPGRSLRVVSNQRTPGLAGARNTGITVARGEFVAQCEDDGVITLDRASRIANACGPSALKAEGGR
jgi:glycosyltransferase involved in cell wall biosynthesis